MYITWVKSMSHKNGGKMASHTHNTSISERLNIFFTNLSFRYPHRVIQSTDHGMRGGEALVKHRQRAASVTSLLETDLWQTDPISRVKHKWSDSQTDHWSVKYGFAFVRFIWLTGSQEKKSQRRVKNVIKFKFQIFSSSQFDLNVRSNNLNVPTWRCFFCRANTFITKCNAMQINQSIDQSVNHNGW